MARTFISEQLNRKLETAETPREKKRRWFGFKDEEPEEEPEINREEPPISPVSEDVTVAGTIPMIEKTNISQLRKRMLGEGVTANEFFNYGFETEDQLKKVGLLESEEKLYFSQEPIKPDTRVKIEPVTYTYPMTYGEAARATSEGGLLQDISNTITDVINPTIRYKGFVFQPSDLAGLATLAYGGWEAIKAGQSLFSRATFNRVFDKLAEARGIPQDAEYQVKKIEAMNWTESNIKPSKLTDWSIRQTVNELNTEMAGGGKPLVPRNKVPVSQTGQEALTKVKQVVSNLPTELFVKVGDKNYKVNSLKEASEKYRATIKESGLGGSEIPTQYIAPKIVDSQGNVIGNIAYNGNIFAGEKWTPESKRIYDATGYTSGQAQLQKQAWEMTRSEYRRTNLTGTISDSAYRGMTAPERLSEGINKSDYSEILTTKNYNGKNIEIRKGTSGYAKTFKEIAAFDGNKRIGNSVYENGATAIFVSDDYQKLGIGTALLTEFRKVYPNIELGQVTTAGYNLVGSYHKKLVEQALSEGKPVPPEVLKDYPDLVKQAPAVAPSTSVQTGLPGVGPETAQVKAFEEVSGKTGQKQPLIDVEKFKEQQATRAETERLKNLGQQELPETSSEAGDIEKAQAELEGIKETLSQDPVANYKFKMGNKSVSLTSLYSIREGSFPEYFTVKQAKTIVPNADYSKFLQKDSKYYNKVPTDILDSLATELGMPDSEALKKKIISIYDMKRRARELEAYLGTAEVSQPAPVSEVTPETTKEEAVQPPVPPLKQEVTEQPPPSPPPATPPPTQPPASGNVPPSQPSAPSLKEMNRIISQAKEVVKQDRIGNFTKIMDRIPGLKQIMEFERPGIKMTGAKEKIIVAYVAESQARNDVLTRANASLSKNILNIRDLFGKKLLKGKISEIKFLGTDEQAKNPITGTFKDIAENPELYELSPEQLKAINDLNTRNSELLNWIKDGYGTEIGEWPAKPNGAYLPNVDISEDVIEAVGSEMRAIASGRQKTRFYLTARDRMAHDKTFKPELNIIKLLSGMDRAKASAAAGQTFRQVIGGKTREEAIAETHPELYKKMTALKKRLQSLRGSAGRLDDKLDKAILEFFMSPLEGEDLTRVQESLDVRLQTGPRKGLGIAGIQNEIDKTRLQIKALKKSWEAANLKPYQFVQEGIYRYYPQDEAKVIKELLKKGSNGFINFIENWRGTAFSGDLSPIVGIQTPLGFFFDPLGSLFQFGGGVAKALKSGNPLVSFTVSELSKDISKNVEGWSQFFSLMGRSQGGVPQEFAGGVLNKIPGFSAFTESTYIIVMRQAKGLYDRTWKSLVKSGIPELTAKVSAITTTSRVFPMLNPARLGQSPARASVLRSLPTSYSFIRQPMSMMVDAAKALGKISTFQRPTPTEGNSLRLIMQLAITLMITSALSQAIDAHRKKKDVKEAVWEAINPDPKNGNFLSIVFDKYRVPIGGPYRALFRAIYPKEIPGIPVPVPFVGLYDYLMNRLNPAARTQLDILQNKDFYDKEIYSGTVPERIWKILAYELEGYLPLSAGAVLESQRTEMTREETLTQVAAQFAGFNLTESKWNEVGTLRDKYSQVEYAKKYEDLNQGERDDLSRNYPDLKKLEDEAKEKSKLRGEELQAVYYLLSTQATDLRNTRMSTIAQALIDGKITKEQYDNERGYIRPYYSGQRNSLWQMKEQLDPDQALQTEQYFDKTTKPEDKAMDSYQEFSNQTIEQAPLPKDWDAINAQINSYLSKLDEKTQKYLTSHKDDWIKDLPEPARSIELQRIQGIDDGTWWDDYRGSQGMPNLNGPSLKKPSIKAPYLGGTTKRKKVTIGKYIK